MKKVILFLSLIVFLFSIKKPLLAAFTQQDFQQQIKSPEMNLSKWVGGDAGVIENTAAGLTRQIIGDIPELNPSQESSPGSYIPGGAIGGITNLIAAMYANPPASSVEYFADLGRNLGIAKPVYAQGTGFEGLKPILPLWKAFRNVAYLFFAIIFVIIGFAIMFRVKLNPQTVISIQNAIPRVVIALILVTFSYAIAGLLIDLIYILIALGIALANSFNLIPTSDIKRLHDLLGTGGFVDLIKVVYGSTTLQFWGTLAAIGALVGAAVGLIVDPSKIAGLAIGAASGAGLFTLIMAVILIFVLFRLLIELIKAYISIILAVIFGPLQIMIGVLPGTQMGFGSWLRNLFANIAVFPAVAIFIIIARTLILHIETNRLWIPPMIGGIGTTVAGIIGFGMLLLLPKVPQMVKEALQVKPFPYGVAIGEALGPLRTPTRMAGLYPIQYGSQRINEIYQQYSTAGGQVSPWVARGKALTDVLKTLGIVK